MEKQRSREGKGLTQGHPDRVWSRPGFEDPNPELFGGGTAALGTRGRRGRGGARRGGGGGGLAWAQNSGEATVIARVEGHAGLFFFEASLVFLCSLSSAC